MNTPGSAYTIRPMTVQDMDAVTALRKQSWIETYVNTEFGINQEWIETYFAAKAEMTPKAEREAHFVKAVEAGTFSAWVAVGENDTLIGTASALTTVTGAQRIGMLYVDKDWHGTGIAAELMQRLIDWFDPLKPIELEVVVYNERAKAFYRKWGFEEEHDKKLHKEKLPEIRMIRQPDNQQGAH